MRLFLFSTLLLLANSNFFAQTNNDTDSTQHKSHLIQDYRIEKLEKTYTENYKLEGFRIQIYSGSKRQPAKQARLKFSQKFKEVNAYEDYFQPYFKVRVGDFKTKLEALKFQKEIIGFFPDCYIVNDQIEFEK